MEVYVKVDDSLRWLDATELLSAMGVEARATTVSDLSAENAELRKRNDGLQAQVAELLDDGGDWERVAIAMGGKVEILTAQLADRNACIEKAFYERDDAVSRVAELRHLLDGAKAGNEIITAENAELKRTVEGLEHELVSARYQRDSVTDQFNQAVKECRHLNGELSDVRKILFDAQQVYGAEVEKNDALLAQVAKLEARRNELVRELADACAERNKFEYRMGELIAQVDELTQANMRQQHTIAAFLNAADEARKAVQP